MLKLNYSRDSSIECGEKRLTLRLSRKLFGIEHWETIKIWLQAGLRDVHWLSAPFRMMTAEEDVPGYPRWKQISVDVLSWVIFHLLVPLGHRLVELWQVIDWTAINRLCSDLYHNSQAGQRAWAPAQLFALLILFIVLPIPSECELLRVVAIVPLYRWFCGFGLFTQLPDHSTLHTFRKRLGVERFEAILSWVVLRCLEAGLITNRWTQKRQAAEGQALWEMALEEAVLTFMAEKEVQTGSDKGKTFAVPQTPEAQRRWLKGIVQRLKGLLPHARGDTDAGVRWTSSVTLVCGYWLGFLVDNLRGVITAVRVVSLNTAQRSQMIVALDAHNQRVGAYPEAVAADSAQDYYPVHQALDERQIRGHIASRNHQGTGGGLGPVHFAVDEHEQLLCPADKPLTPGKSSPDDGKATYKAQVADCASCSRQAECLPKGQQPDGPRRIRLFLQAHQRWLQNLEHTRTQEYKAAQKKRFASEGWFGLAVRLYGAAKMPYRSQPMNQIAGLMTGIAMNLTLLMRHGQPASSTVT